MHDLPPGPVWPPPASPPRRGLPVVLVLVAVGVVAGVLLTVGVGAVFLVARHSSGHATAAEPVGRPAGPAPDSSQAAGRCTWTPSTGSDEKSVGTPPAEKVRRAGLVTMTVTTNLGVIEVTMSRQDVPCTTASLAFLSGRHYFDGSSCHRLTTEGIFVVQCGDPSGTGQGGPGYLFDDENLPVGVSDAYKRGVVAMANKGANTNGSQFFFCYRDSPLPPSYSVLGTVTKGMDILDKVAAGGHDNAFADAGGGHPNTKLEIRSLTVAG
jgi:peptidyl-prolyl cis-trans isomerase B (cyclophilin B)